MPHLPISHNVENDILDINGVTSVGQGLINGQTGLIIGVDIQQNVQSVRQQIQSQFGTTIQGSQYEIRVTGQFTPLQITIGAVPRKALIPQRTQRVRPIPAGVSIGHVDITAGTTGFLLTNGNTVFPSSNNHVLANVNQANTGDSILQPGPFDGGTQQDKVAELEDFIPVQNGATVDLAWARATDAEFINEVLDLGEPAQETMTPQPGDELVKSGRTTAVTRGTIQQVGASVNVNYGEAGVITLTDQIVTNKMLEGGDSGSAAFIEQNGELHPAGLAFAGSSVTSIFNTISNVVSESGMDVLPVSGNLLGGFGVNQQLTALLGGSAIGGAVLRDILQGL